jgi:hypothetical protein
MANNNYIPSIDYTSRDYASIRQDLVNLIPTFVPNWTTRDPSDFGIAILEMFAYMGDVLNYYIDRAANEAFITTASQRANVLSLATLLGYAATDSTASTVTVKFTNTNTSTASVTVPALTQIATTNISNGVTSQVIFETDKDVVVPSSGTNYATVTATQGVTVSNELVGTSTGAAGQTFVLSQFPVINDSMTLTVGGTNYEKVEYLIDYNGYDPVFVSTTNAIGHTYIVFGDNISGRIPPASTPIYVTYRVGGGVIGNVSAGTIKYITKFSTGSIPAGLTVINDSVAATGGAETESTDSIRVNAPLSIRALNRAVSLDDYASLALQVSGIAKAIAAGTTYNNIVLYFVPYGDSGLAVDGVTPSTIFNAYVQDLALFFTGKTPAGTTITYQPPAYATANAIVNVTVLPTYRQSIVQTAVTAALQSLFYIDNVAFNDTIAVSDVYSTVASVEGVASSQILKLVRSDKDYTYVITNKASTGTVATLTTSTTHKLTTGMTVQVSGVDATYNGIYVVTAVTSNTFSYALTSAVQSTTTATGSVTNLVVNDIVCGTYEIPRLITGSLTVNTVGGIVG